MYNVVIIIARHYSTLKNVCALLEERGIKLHCCQKMTASISLLHKCAYITIYNNCLNSFTIVESNQTHHTYWQMLSIECSWKLSGNELEEHDSRLLLNAVSGHCSLLANSTVQRNMKHHNLQNKLARQAQAIVLTLPFINFYETWIYVYLV